MAETELPAMGLCRGSGLCPGNWETSAASQARVVGESWGRVVAGLRGSAGGCVPDGSSWNLSRRLLLESRGSVICLEWGGLYTMGEFSRRASWQERHGGCEIQDFGTLKSGSIAESTFSSFSEHIHIYVHLKLHIYGSLYRWTYMIICIRFYIY